jgi:tRNA-specific 2-thiouridylase
MEKNEVYVTTDLNDGSLWRDTVKLASVHWINDAPTTGEYNIRVRHRAKLVKATLTYENEDVYLHLDNAERAVAPGQSVVIYDGDVCLGGGIIV